MALNVLTPAASVRVVLPSPGPQVMTTVWVSKGSGSPTVPVTVAVPFSLIGAMAAALGAETNVLLRKYSPLVPPSPVTRTRYLPVTTGWNWMNSFRPSGSAVPEATSTPDGLYNSIFG